MADAPGNLDILYRIGEFVVLGGGVAFAILRTGRTVGEVVQKFEGMLEQQSQEISDLKATVKELSKVVIDMARQEGRINLIEERINATSRAMEDRQIMTGKRLDDLTARFNASLEGK